MWITVAAQSPCQAPGLSLTPPGDHPAAGMRQAELQRARRRPRPDGRAGRSWTTHRPNPPPALSGKHSAKQPPAQNIPFLASEDTHSRLGSAAHMSGYTRGLPEQTHCVAQGALEEK